MFSNVSGTLWGGPERMIPPGGGGVDFYLHSDPVVRVKPRHRRKRRHRRKGTRSTKPPPTPTFFHKVLQSTRNVSENI